MLSIATVVQNEAKWLPEWLEYHALPHVGVASFLLYDDGSTDDADGALAPYERDALVRRFTTEQLRPWGNTTLIKPHTRVIIPLFVRKPGPPPYSHWCIRVEPFPQQIAMMRPSERPSDMSDCTTYVRCIGPCGVIYTSYWVQNLFTQGVFTLGFAPNQIVVAYNS